MGMRPVPAVATPVRVVSFGVEERLTRQRGADGVPGSRLRGKAGAGQGCSAVEATRTAERGKRVRGKRLEEPRASAAVWGQSCAGIGAPPVQTPKQAGQSHSVAPARRAQVLRGLDCCPLVPCSEPVSGGGSRREAVPCGPVRGLRIYQIRIIARKKYQKRVNDPDRRCRQRELSLTSHRLRGRGIGGVGVVGEIIKLGDALDRHIELIVIDGE